MYRTTISIHMQFTTVLKYYLDTCAGSANVSKYYVNTFAGSANVSKYNFNTFANANTYVGMYPFCIRFVFVFL